MKRYLLLFLIIVFGANTKAQSFELNLGFDTWTPTTVGSVTYEEPNGWATANPIVALSPLIYPVTTSKTTDAHSGDFAARIETKSVLTILASGTVATGVFDAGATAGQNLKLGRPFTDRPDKFQGWFKYTSISGDSCHIIFYSHKWNSSTNSRDTIGYVRFAPDYNVSSYTNFDLNIDYKTADNPDSVSIVFASSGGGATFQGQVGSTLWIDDIELVSLVGIPQVLMPEVAVTTFPNPASEVMTISLSKTLPGATVDLYNVQGQKLNTLSMELAKATLDLSGMAAGKYFFVIRHKDHNVNSGSFIVQ